MKAKFKMIVTIILIIAIVISGWFFIKHEKKKEAEKEKEVLYMLYTGTAEVLDLNMDKSKYEQTGNPEDIIFAPTELTFDLLDRWEFISNKFPEIVYADESIEEGDWVQVLNVLGSNAFEMEDASTKIGEELADKHGESINYMDIYNYIYYNNKGGRLL